MNSKLLKKALDKLLGLDSQLYSFHHLGGGEYNQKFKLISGQGVFFAKVQEAGKYGNTFEKEREGIQTILKTKVFRMIKPVGITTIDGFEIFISEFVDSPPKDKLFWSSFGSNLAQLHKISNRNFGFTSDNYLGYCSQINHKMDNWSQFFLNNRIHPHLKIASENLLIDAEMQKKFEKYCQMFDSIFPIEPPALLHGNLNAHSFLVDSDGLPIACNPSVYFGHREMDLARTKYIGTFPPAFYEAYHDTYPLQNDWELRSDFYNMYYHLVNLTTYGIPYLPNVVANLNKWVN
jgi:fructosamine-3-kinase